jgi:hypothetical protein
VILAAGKEAAERALDDRTELPAQVLGFGVASLEQAVNHVFVGKVPHVVQDALTRSRYASDFQ